MIEHYLGEKRKRKNSFAEKFLHFEKPKKYFVEFLTRHVFVKLHFFAGLHCVLLCD